MIERAPALLPMTDVLRFLLEYPSATLERSSDFFYCQEAQFGLKLTIRINHLAIQDRPGSTVIASKMLTHRTTSGRPLNCAFWCPIRHEGQAFGL